jgi:hypothetical protein
MLLSFPAATFIQAMIQTTSTNICSQIWRGRIYSMVRRGMMAVKNILSATLLVTITMCTRIVVAREDAIGLGSGSAEENKPECCLSCYDAPQAVHPQPTVYHPEWYIWIVAVKTTCAMKWNEMKWNSPHIYTDSAYFRRTGWLFCTSVHLTRRKKNPRFQKKSWSDNYRRFHQSINHQIFFFLHVSHVVLAIEQDDNASMYYGLDSGDRTLSSWGDILLYTDSKAYFALYKTLHKVQIFRKKFFFLVLRLLLKHF